MVTSQRPRYLCVCVAIFFSFLQAGLAESPYKYEARVKKEAHIRMEPSLAAQSLGRLPEGSMVLVSGEERDGYLAVKVELEDNTTKQGWMLSSALSYDLPGDNVNVGSARVQRKFPKEPTEPETSGEVLRPGRRLRIPKDEGLLLRRQPTFFYGMHLGSNYSFITSTSNYYTDPGYAVGAQVGMYLASVIPVRIQMGYGVVRGTASNGSGFDLGFFDTAVHAAYLMGPGEFSLGLLYAYGASVSTLPTEIKIQIPADLSSLYICAGAGYGFFLSELAKATLRLTARYSLQQLPLAIQVVGFELVVDLNV